MLPASSRYTDNPLKPGEEYHVGHVPVGLLSESKRDNYSLFCFCYFSTLVPLDLSFFSRLLLRVSSFLEVHPLKPGEEYLLGMFLSGSYQEAMGSFHNLFGDVNTLHVELDPEDKQGYTVEYVSFSLFFFMYCA